MDTPERSAENLTNARERIIAAAQSGDCDRFFDELREIDRLLTEPTREIGTFPQTGSLANSIQLDETKNELHDFLNDVKENQWGSLRLYLGDGGMSRLLIDFEPGKEQPFRIGVSEYNSMPKVIERWNAMNTSTP